MLILRTTLTLGWDIDQDMMGNTIETPIEETFTLKASRDNLDVLLRGIRRILENSLAEECYVTLREDDGRMSFSGTVFDGLPSIYDELSHHRGFLLRALEHNGL